MSHSTRKPRAWQEAVFVPGLLLVLTAIDFWPQLFQGKALYWGDIGLYFTPMTAFLHTQLCQGRFPLWNPWILCGTPFVGNPQVWPLYPSTILLPTMSAAYFLSLNVALHVWLTACGTYVFLRHAQARHRAAALLGAIVFAFGGQMISKEQFPNMVQAIAWLPWILYGVYRLTETWKIGDALWLGLMLGLQILAAHAQMTMLTLYLAIFYGLTRLTVNRPTWSRFVFLLGVIAVIAFGLSAGQVLPSVELYRDAWRQKLSFMVVNRFYLPPNQLGNFVLPSLHGHPFAGNFTARGNYWETCCYLGVFGFALAAIGGYCAWRRHNPVLARFWTVIFFAGTWMAMGGGGGLYHFAYFALPGFRSFHDPARCLLWSAWAAAVLSAHGWQIVSVRFIRPVRIVSFAVIFATLFIDLMHFNRIMYPLASPQTIAVAPAEAAFFRADPAFAAHQARLIAPDSARVWQRFTTHRSYRQNAPDYQQHWADTLTPNLPMRFGLPDAYGYEPLTRADAQTVAGMAAVGFRPEASPAERRTAGVIAGMLGVRTVAFFRVHAPDGTFTDLSPLGNYSTLPPLGKKADAAKVFLANNTAWQPRAGLVTNVFSVPGRADALSLIRRVSEGAEALDLSKTTILVGPKSKGLSSSVSPGAVKIICDQPDTVIIDVYNKVPCWLVLADTMHPGWQAREDGRTVAIISADGFLRAVFLPTPGRHLISFDYLPTSFRLGLYLSFFTLAFLVGWGIAAVTAGRISPRRQEFRESEENKRRTSPPKPIRNLSQCNQYNEPFRGGFFLNAP